MLAPQRFAIVGHGPAAGRLLKDLIAGASGSLAGVFVWILVVAAMALF